MRDMSSDHTNWNSKYFVPVSYTHLDVYKRQDDEDEEKED